MRKALLIADGQPDVDPNSLNIYETQTLIELYPIILSRHFMVRVNALVRHLKNNPIVFGGQMINYWLHIEFQNRGSPHLHNVVEVENHPPFDTEEGIRMINHVCSCEMPPEDSQLHNLVVEKQVHGHRRTGTKNNNKSCRFGFPRSVCPETRIVAYSSDDFLRTNGRACLLKRTANETMVNKYNPFLLSLWKANMDIQPCGSNESIAYYIAKYMYI